MLLIVSTVGQCVHACGRLLAGFVIRYKCYSLLLYVTRYNLIITVLNYTISVSGGNYLKHVDHRTAICVGLNGLDPLRNGPNPSEPAVFPL